MGAFLMPTDREVLRMADDDKSKETEDKSTDTEDDKKPDTGSGDELEKWKALARKHEKDAKANAKRAQELEDRDKTESQKAADRSTKAESDAAKANAEVLKLRVALKKGLSETQAKRLVGETEEELESDADELLESFKPSDDKGKPGSKPTEDLKGGGDPTEDPEEMDPRKLADMVPRY